MREELLESAVKAALEVRENAYAPYSKFKVGALLVAESGNFYSGVNVENSSFGATNCAERTALFSAVTAGETSFDFIVIASALNGKAVYPCGICRQVLADFNPNLVVVLVNAERGEVENRLLLSEIFPAAFEF